MTKTMSIIIAVLLVLVLAVGVTAGVTKGFQDWNLGKEPVEETPMDEEPATVVTAETKLFLSAGEAYAASEGGSVNKDLTAIILPADAVDKSVDWTVVWGENSTRANENVSNYVTVTPSSDGAATATVSCYQSFEGDIIVVTVRTRMGGFSASCTVQYAGIPESLAIDTASLNSVSDNSWNVDVVEMLCGSEYYLPLNLDNSLHQVGSSFANNYMVSATAHGGINAHIETYDSDGNHTGTSSAQYNLTVSDLWESNGYVYTSISEPGGMLIHVKASIENGQLKVEPEKAITAYGGISVGRGGRAESTFGSYIDNKIPYTTITVTETSTGISYSINIRTIATIQSVALSASSLTF